jgi:hypothetical protein
MASERNCFRFASNDRREEGQAMSAGQCKRRDPPRPDFADGDKADGAGIEDLDFDLQKPPGLVRPRRRLTNEERAVLGPLAKAQVVSDNPADILAGLYECCQSQLRDDLCADPASVRMALGALRRAYEILIDEGYPFEGLLSDLEAGLEKVARAARTIIVRRYLSKTSAEEVEEAGRVLMELIECGAWPNWQVELEAEVARCGH